jgi:hypothetical protein
MHRQAGWQRQAQRQDQERYKPEGDVIMKLTVSEELNQLTDAMFRGWGGAQNLGPALNVGRVERGETRRTM